jgi:hypothetical protein
MNNPGKMMNTTGVLYTPNTSINKPMANPQLGKAQTTSLLLSNTFNSLSRKGRMKMSGGQTPNINSLINQVSRPIG